MLVYKHATLPHTGIQYYPGRGLYFSIYNASSPENISLRTTMESVADKMYHLSF